MIKRRKIVKPYFEAELGKLYHGDCLEIMPEIGPVDLILADPPYGTIACKWDSIIPLEPMWTQLKRIIKKNGAIVMTASQPFTTILISSNMKMFRYEWIWIKSHPSNSLLAKRQPLKYHENICVFYQKQPIYNPQMEVGKPNHTRKKNGEMESEIIGQKIKITKLKYDGLKYPKSYYIDKTYIRREKVHPAQKPVALMEYLIKTYTNEGEQVLDFTGGSGTTGIACERLNREYILIEKELKYCEIAKQRIIKEVNNKKEMSRKKTIIQEILS